MKEVTVKIRFTTPCLGNVRHRDCDTMVRDSVSGEVIFLQSWWNACLTKAATAYGKHQNLVSQIQWDPHIDGPVKVYSRGFGPGPNDFKKHEAFVSGTIVAINAMLPDGMELADFEEILEIAGKYYGMSPYGWDRDFGRFVVEEVRPRLRSVSR